jgi:hypothetical protein
VELNFGVSHLRGTELRSYARGLCAAILSLAGGGAVLQILCAEKLG